MNPPFRSKPELVCSQCGRPGAFAFDEPLCVDCYHARGSCGAVREVELPEREEKMNKLGELPLPSDGEAFDQATRCQV